MCVHVTKRVSLSDVFVCDRESEWNQSIVLMEINQHDYCTYNNINIDANTNNMHTTEQNSHTQPALLGGSFVLLGDVERP